MRDEDIEYVAKRMCESLGFEPTDKVMAVRSETLTPYERARGNGLTDEYSEVEQWMTYRSEAAKAIAAVYATKDVNW